MFKLNGRAEYTNQKQVFRIRKCMNDLFINRVFEIFYRVLRESLGYIM